jgi:hypothetical protein
MAQLFDVLFSDLRSSKRSLNRLLTLGILFILIGHFYVVEPYFPYKAQERNIHDEKKLLKQQEQELLGRLENIKGVSQGVEKTLTDIQKQIDAYPTHLGEMRPKIDGALQSGSSSAPLQFGEISLQPPIKTPEEGVRKYIEAWFINLIEKINNGIEAEVSKLNSGQKRIIVSSLLDEADKAANAFKNGLEDLKRKNPYIFIKYEGEGDMATFQLQKVVVDSFDPVKKEVFSLLKITEDNLNIIKGELNTIQSLKDNLRKQREKLESSLDSLQSPLGPVPVGLKDFIVLFPFFIVALLVMITAAIHKSGYLYLAFWREYSRQNTTKDREAFQLFADCWYLPTKKSIVKLLLLIILLSVVSGIFIRASWLVISNADAELFTFLFPAEESSTKNVFTGVYIFGAFVVVGCFGIIFQALWRITRESIE